MFFFSWWSILLLILMRLFGDTTQLDSVSYILTCIFKFSLATVPPLSRICRFFSINFESHTFPLIFKCSIEGFFSTGFNWKTNSWIMELSQGLITEYVHYALVKLNLISIFFYCAPNFFWFGAKLWIGLVLVTFLLVAAFTIIINASNIGCEMHFISTKESR